MGQEKLSLKNLSLIRSMAAMGGGIASSGGPCGALIGGVTLLGSVMGRGEPAGKDDPVMWKSAYVLYKRFENEVAAEWDSVNCGDIAGVDWKDKEQTRDFYKGEAKFKCADNTGKTARILGEVLEKYFGDRL